MKPETTPTQAGASGMTTLPAAPVRVASVRPDSTRIPLPGAGEAREQGLVISTRDVALALRDQRVTLVDAARYPSGLYVLLKIREPGPGMDVRTRDALMRIRKDFPLLSRRGLARQPYGHAPLTAEGYKGALALLAPLLHPRGRGEAPRWLPNVTAAQVSQLIDNLIK